MKRSTTKDCLPDYFHDPINSSVIYEYWNKKKEGSKKVQVLAIRKILAFRYKDVMMSFLLHLNEDLDDDLLLDAIDLIVTE